MCSQQWLANVASTTYTAGHSDSGVEPVLGLLIDPSSRILMIPSVKNRASEVFRTLSKGGDQVLRTG